MSKRERILSFLKIGDFLIGVALLVVLLVTGWALRLRDGVLQISTNYSVALFLYVTVLMLLSKVLGGVFDVCRYRLENWPYGPSQKFRGWLYDEIKGFVLGLVIGAVVAEVIYFIIRVAPQVWWLVSWAVFLGMFVFLTSSAHIVLFPIFYKFEPLDDVELEQRILVLNDRAGTRISGVYEWRLSERSNRANAMTAGLGRTRRIIIADNLLRTFPHDEIEAIIAYSIGRHVHKHILKGIFVQAVTTFLGFWVAGRAVQQAVRHNWFMSSADFATLPLLVLVSIVFSFLMMPLLNAYSRSRVFEADRYAVDLLPDPQQIIACLDRLGLQSARKKERGQFVSRIFQDYPSVPDRIDAVQDYIRAKAQQDDLP